MQEQVKEDGHTGRTEEKDGMKGAKCRHAQASAEERRAKQGRKARCVL